MKNEKVSLKLSSRTVENKVDFGKGVVNSMTGNAYFPSPVPALAAVTNAINNLDAAKVAALDGGKSKTAVMHQNEAIVDNLLLQLGNYVESVAIAKAALGGDAKAVITGAGMDYRKQNSLSSVPDAPINVKADTTKSEGEITISWDKVAGAHAYVIEMSTDSSVVGSRLAAPPVGGGVVTPTFAVFTMVKILSQRKFTLTGLDSGTKYALRVYAVGTHGYGTYSNVVVAKAL
ncbi:MAG: fibronectin type III domain-containing protein [Bacteroidia bacterium]